MSLWQFAACVDGYNRANSTEETPPEMTSAEAREILERNAAFIAAGASGKVH